MDTTGSFKPPASSESGSEKPSVSAGVPQSTTAQSSESVIPEVVPLPKEPESVPTPGGIPPLAPADVAPAAAASTDAEALPPVVTSEKTHKSPGTAKADHKSAGKGASTSKSSAWGSKKVGGPTTSKAEVAALSKPVRRPSQVSVASAQAVAASGAQRFLNLWLFIGVCMGIVLGLLVRNTSPGPFTERTLMYVAFPGDLLLRLLRLTVLPLITASIVAAIGGVDLKLAGRLGRRAFIYYMATTVIAEIEGLILVFLISPGSAGTPSNLAKAPPKRVFYVMDAVMDIIRNMVPPNIIEATMYSWNTKIILPMDPPEDNSTNTTIEIGEPKYLVELAYGTNVLGLLCFAVVIGAVIASTGDRNSSVHDLAVSITDIMMSFIRLIMWYCPIGVGFLIAHRILATQDLGRVLSQLGLYVVTVLLGLAIHLGVVLTLIYSVFVQHGYANFALAMIAPALMAISTSSSSATVPVTIATLEERVGLDSRVVRFMVPVGATVNMDGAALYEAVSAIFLAQLHGIHMDFGRVLAVSVTATVASVGAAGIPGGGLVTMIIVLQAVGLPAEDIGLIATVDWFLDRFRTVVNVMGDCVGAAVVHHISKADLKAGGTRRSSISGLSAAIKAKAFV